MPTEFKTIGIFGKYGDPGIAQTVTQLADFLKERHLEAWVDEETARSVPNLGLKIGSCHELGKCCDLAVVVGGDGTLLTVARTVADQGISIVGVNLGRLGFLTDISPTTMLDVMEEILAGNYCSEERFLLHAVLKRNGKTLHEDDAFNEVVVHKWNMARMIEFETYVNDQFVDVQRSDGIIISTPTGSTAYALSGGGPLLMPTLNAICLVPVCPHTLSNRPIVVEGDSRISVVIRDCKSDHAQMTCDGHNNQDLHDGDRIEITKKPRPIRLIHPANHDHFQILRAKLRWGSKRE